MNNKFIIALLGALLILLASIIPHNPLYQANWALLTSLIVLVLLVIIFWTYDKSSLDLRQISFLGTIAAVAAASRVAFAGIASVQPATFIIIMTGYIFGGQAGFITGAVCALVSNFFLGQGPWTPWQMLAWGLCGFIASWLGKSDQFRLFPLAFLGIFCGYLFGMVMNTWHWVALVYPLNVKTFLATYAASLPFDTLHAAGNLAFVIFLGHPVYSILSRFETKMSHIPM